MGKEVIASAYTCGGHDAYLYFLDFLPSRFNVRSQVARAQWLRSCTRLLVPFPSGVNTLTAEYYLRRAVRESVTN